MNKDNFFIVVTRDSTELNYGQTGNVIGFNEFSDEVYFRPHGYKKIYRLHYTQVWCPSESDLPYGQS
jgi:hypothetical protein